MESLGSLILFIVLFYVMMRFGCGAHMAHGHAHHDSNDDHDGGGKKPIGHKFVDPVCGMEVEPSEGYGKMYEGIPYRFCSRDCLDKFDADSRRYVGHKGDLAVRRRLG